MRGEATTEREKSEQDEALNQELDDSFPASDPPQTTQPHLRVGGPHRADARPQEESKVKQAKAKRAKARA
jgi:hypothetical protein